MDINKIDLDMDLDIDQMNGVPRLGTPSEVERTEGEGIKVSKKKKRRENREESALDTVNDILSKIEEGAKNDDFFKDLEFFELYKRLINASSKLAGADLTILYHRIKQDKKVYNFNLTDFKKNVASIIKEREKNEKELNQKVIEDLDKAGEEVINPEDNDVIV